MSSEIKEYNYNASYKYHKDHSIPVKLFHLFLIFLLLPWSAYEIISNNLAYLLISLNPISLLFILWKQIAALTLILYWSFLKQTKITRDIKLSISDTDITLTVENVKFNTSKYPKQTIVKEKYPLKKIKQILPQEGNIKIVGTLKTSIYDTNGKRITKWTSNDNTKIIYIPTECIMEVYKDINNRITNLKKAN